MTKMGDTLQQGLALLAENGANHFDPARFCYVESLARRAIGKPESIRRRIQQKALEALGEYQACLDQARSDSADIVVRISSKYPDSADRIQRLFKKNDFRGVKRLSQRLDRDTGPKALAALTHQITQGETRDKNQMPLTFDDLLRQQENEVIQSIDNSQAGENSTGTEKKTGLRSFHLFQESWARRHSDRLVIRALKERPENPGPLNAQMLMTKSLSVMHDLSPSYLNRFVSYIDTLLWLEKTGETKSK